MVRALARGISWAASAWLWVSPVALSCVSCASPKATASVPARASSDVAEPEAGSRGAARIERRVVVSLGRKSGESVLRVAGDGTLTVALDVLWNGRGAHVKAALRLADDGTPSAFDASGQHELGTKFTSLYRREGDRSHWQSDEESGDRSVTGPVFYLPLVELSELDGWLVGAALRQGGAISLLPAGEARVSKATEVEIGCAQQTRHLVAYAIDGINLAPSYTWMYSDGNWFGSVSEWYSVVPEGCESAIEPLVVEQRKLERARDARNVTELAHVAPGAGLAYTHARVLDVEHGRWLSDQTVVIVGEKISAVGASRSLPVPAGAEVIDLAGKALIPGLWDMHGHLTGEDGALNIASGVTSVRDVGNDPDMLDELGQRYARGAAIGPHVYKFGLIEGRNEKALASKVTAETPEEARAAVRFFVDRKYDGIKIYNSVRPELVPILTSEAHAHGLQVTGHVPVHMLANEAVRAGYDGIEHVNMLFLNFFATHETDTRDTTRFTLVGDKAADFDLDAEPAREFFALLEQHHTVIDPTVGIFEDLLLGEQGKVLPGLEALVARLPVTVQRSFLFGGLPLGDKRERYRASFDKLLAMVKALYDDGITLLLGTDSLAGLMLHHEMSMFARAGVPNAAILKMATLGAARVMRVDGQTGSIQKGKVADLVVIDGDPLARIDDIGKVVSTLRSGVVFDSAAVYRTVSVR
jgi:amidohydrolase family protein